MTYEEQLTRVQRDILTRLLSNAKGRANNSNGTKGKTCEYTLDREWVAKKLLDDNHHCPRTGIEYNYDEYKSWHKRGGHPARPSINRLNPSKGYTPDNCEVVSNFYNNMLGPWNRSELTHHIRGVAKDIIGNKGKWWQRLLVRFL